MLISNGHTLGLLQPESLRVMLLAENTDVLSVPTLLAKVELISPFPLVEFGKLGLVERFTLKPANVTLVAPAPGAARKDIPVMLTGFSGSCPPPINS